jgi:fused signal recognition particle receptor
MGFFDRLLEGLRKTRGQLSGRFDELFAEGRRADDDFYDELEETLIMADAGMDTACTVIEALRSAAKEKKLNMATALKPELKAIITGIMKSDTEFLAGGSGVVLVVGVNGVGKTTTIGKLAKLYKTQGKKVLLAAADTFRAAASEQLCAWGERSGVQVIKHGEGADPAAVVFDAVSAAKARGTDVLICDTAGRLHNKKNLMAELEKMNRVIRREWPEAQCEVLLVLDATTGQNAIIQAKLFMQSVPLTGIVLTKLDGTAKGGVVISVKRELDIPVRFIGIGEGADDLQPFNAESFAEAIL